VAGNSDRHRRRENRRIPAETKTEKRRALAKGSSMSRHRISGSIFWGLTFLAIGVLFLIRNLGYAVPLWTLFFRYWPVLLIVWGLFKLVDYFRMEPGTKAQPLFSAGDVTAIIFVILFGSLLTFAANLSPDLGQFFKTGNFDLWDITGNYFTFNEKHQMVAGPDSVIEITNRFGDIEVSPSDDNQIVVDVRKSVRAVDQGDAEKISAGFVYSIVNEDGKYRIGSPLDRRFKVSLTVQVPKRSSVTVENRNGKVSLRGLTGSQKITNRFGTVDVRNISGALTVEDQNGGVTVDDVSDSVSIANSFGPITAANIRGDLKINGRNNSIDIDHIEKDLEVESAFQNVDIRDPRGAVKVTNRNGEVSIRLLQKPTKDVSVTSEFGSVNIEIPAGSSFVADVHNRFGSIHSDFSELQSSAEHNSNRRMDGTVGSGGPTIRVESRNGEIRFRKKG
jgi:hypothetical protein